MFGLAPNKARGRKAVWQFSEDTTLPTSFFLAD
jgi:hypothetical protein